MRLSALLLLQGATASPHEAFQMRQPIQRSPQQYGRSAGRRLQEQSCQEIATGAWEPIRIGYELLDTVEPALVDELMAQAVGFYSSTLQVRRAQAPLLMERAGTGCFRYGFDNEVRCQTLTAPTCGGLVDEKYLKAGRACQESCAPAFSCSGSCLSSGNSCACDVDLWSSTGDSYCCSLVPGNDCPGSCSLSTATKVGNGTSGAFVCEASCSEAPSGAGAADVDLQIFVTVRDTVDCQSSSSLLAFAGSCAVDQCDRPIFGTINFCPKKLGGALEALVSTAIHELAHVLVFSNTHFRNFRYADGSPMIPRKPNDETAFQNEIYYSCSSAGYQWDVPAGDYRYVDMSPTILNAFTERGYSCQCPIGSSSISSGCFYADPNLQVPSCVVRMTTPTVLAEVRDFFDCPSLQGAELENQEGAGCHIIGSHWEQRVFAGEIMSPVSTEQLIGTYISRVSLAVFQDSGWYQANMSMAHNLVKGVHWGYKKGCAFATELCVNQDVPLDDRLFCASNTDQACSLDRQGVMACDVGAAWTGLPGIYASYTTSNRLGAAAEMDYCPHYAITLSNRVCTNSTSSTMPYVDVNFMRETFSAGSRCLMSTLHADAPAPGGGTYPAPTADFQQPKPRCYEVSCGDSSYEVKVADLSTGAVVSIGTCSSEGQALTMAGGGGSVTCAAPEEVCSQLTQPLAHPGTTTGAGTTGSPGTSGTSGTGSTTTGTTGTTGTTRTGTAGSTSVQVAGTSTGSSAAASTSTGMTGAATTIATTTRGAEAVGTAQRVGSAHAAMYTSYVLLLSFVSL